jgi:hypothetical protein
MRIGKGLRSIFVDSSGGKRKKLELKDIATALETGYPLEPGIIIWLRMYA